MSEFRISLRITHPKMPSDEITKSLELAPIFSYTAGDKKLTPKGTEIPGRRKESYWCHDVPASADDIESNIADCNAILANRRDVLLRIVDSGGRVEYFVGWFSSDNSGFVLRHELLRQLADLRIDLSFDLYTTERGGGNHVGTNAPKKAAHKKKQKKPRRGPR